MRRPEGWWRLHIRLVWRDLWVGVYVSEEHVYICLVPCFPIIWDRA